MDFTWLLLGFVAVVLVIAFLHVVGRMASEREAMSRRKKASAPLSGDTVTYAGRS